MKKVGVFETFRSYPGGVLWRFGEHWSRWQRSAELCGFEIPVERETVNSMLEEVLNNSSEVRLRLWSDGEDWELEVSPLPEGPEVIKIKDEVFGRENPQAKHDNHDYQQFFDKDWFETIWFDDSDILLEGNITNVFALIDGKLCTPKLGKILPGLMRHWVIDNFSVVERDISRTELLQADEIIVTNMVRGVAGVDEWGEWRKNSDNMTKKLTCQIPGAP